MRGDRAIERGNGIALAGQAGPHGTVTFRGGPIPGEDIGVAQKRMHRHAEPARFRARRETEHRSPRVIAEMQSDAIGHAVKRRATASIPARTEGGIGLAAIRALGSRMVMAGARTGSCRSLGRSLGGEQGLARQQGTI